MNENEVSRDRKFSEMNEKFDRLGFDEYCKECLKRKWVSILANYYDYLQELKWVTSKDDWIPISSHGHSNVRKVEKLSELGIIYRMTDEYIHNINGMDNICYEYSVNKPLLNKILKTDRINELLENKTIEDIDNIDIDGWKFILDDDNDKYVTEISSLESNRVKQFLNRYHKINPSELEKLKVDIKEINNYDIATNSITLNRPDPDVLVNSSLNKTYDSIPSINSLDQSFYNNYKYIKHYYDVVGVINENATSIYEVIKYRPKFVIEDNKLVKVGIRATNKLCNKYHADRHPDKPYEGSIEYELNKFFPNGYTELDVNASIFRITRYIRYGRYDKDDIYEVINGAPFASKEDRDTFKRIMMELYMPNYSKEKIIQGCIYTNLKEHKLNLDKEWLSKIYDNMISYVGKPFHSEIFLHESNIYIRIREAFYLYKIPCLQIYDNLIVPSDALYEGSKLNEDTFNRIVELAILDYIERSGIRYNG